MKAKQTGILILIILICGCIESDTNPVVKENISTGENKTPDETSDETLNESIESIISNETGNEPGLENKTPDETLNKSIKEPGLENKKNNSKVNNSVNISEVENAEKNITPTPGLTPQAKRIKFDIYGMNPGNIDPQELESRLEIDVEGIIYVRISGADEKGVVVYDESKITRDQVVKEAGIIKTPGGIIVRDFRITVTEETNCTKLGNKYRCCNDRECGIYDM